MSNKNTKNKQYIKNIAPEENFSYRKFKKRKHELDDETNYELDDETNYELDDETNYELDDDFNNSSKMNGGIK